MIIVIARALQHMSTKTHLVRNMVKQNLYDLGTMLAEIPINQYGTTGKRYLRLMNGIMLLKKPRVSTQRIS